MYILFSIILVVLFIHQSQRINRIESLLKKNSGSRTPDPISTSNSSPATSPVPAPTSTPVTATEIQSTPMSQAPSTATTVPTTSDEESSGRLLGGLGITAVIIGVGFFIKYAFDNNWIGPAGRVMIGILIGVIIMAIGQWLRKKYLGYSDLLMGGGLVILYVALYASYGFYHLVDPMLAFLGMVLVTAIGVGLSLFNATQTLAFVSFAGGYLAPFMIGQNDIGHWTVFTYVTVLNIGILAILVSKKWTGLIMVGLIATAMHFSSWYFSEYEDSLLVPTLIFVLIQFILFTASSLTRIIIEKLKATELDYFVLGSTALGFADVSYQLLIPEYRPQAAIGAVIIAGFYMAIALLAYRENPEDRSINIFLPGISVSFLTAAIPIQFSGPWIAAWWLIESLILYIIASKSSSRGFQVMGVAVYILGLIDLFWYIATYRVPAEGFTVFFNGPFIMIMMAVVVAYMIAFIYYRFGSTSEEIRKRGITVFVVLANILTLYAFTTQIIEYYRAQADIAGYTNALTNTTNTTVSVFWTLYAALLTALGFAKRYVSLRTMGLVLFLITAFKVLIDVWRLGEIYRIISFIAFGIIALTASFMYVKYKDRLHSGQ